MSIADRLRRPNHRLTPLGWAVLLAVLAAMVLLLVVVARLPGANPWWLLGLAVIGGLGRLVGSVLGRRLQPARPPGGQPADEGHRRGGGDPERPADPPGGRGG
ncbi:MAG: hypothetical protein WC068_07825 [Caulobacter sp.]